MTRLLVFLLLLICATLLTGCGIRGELKTPPPVWGADKAEVTEEAEGVADVTPEEPSDLTEEEDPGYGIEVANLP